MSAALSTAPADQRRMAAIAAHPSSGSGRRGLTTFPIGARFPRRTLAQRAHSPARQHAEPTHQAPVFPVGARFRRATERDVLTYLANRIAGADTVLTAPRRIYPVGARFPRR